MDCTISMKPKLLSLTIPSPLKRISDDFGIATTYVPFSQLPTHLYALMPVGMINVRDAPGKDEEFKICCSAPKLGVNSTAASCITGDNCTCSLKSAYLKMSSRDAGLPLISWYDPILPTADTLSKIPPL
jgi:hypothetical protein